MLHTLLIEVYPEHSEPLESALDTPESFDLAPEMRLAELQCLIKQNYQWALDLPLDWPEAKHYFWYFSEDSEEPLLGVRGQDPGVEFERPVDIPFRIQHLAADLDHLPPDQTVGRLMLTHPEHRFIVQRVQSLQGFGYAEPRTNLLAADIIPLYLQRFQLAMYGMERFNPQSIYWVRVTLMQGAPIARDLADGNDKNPDDWVFPLKPRLETGHDSR